MHSIYSRANSLFAFMLWVLAAVTFACFLSTTFLDYSTNVEITVNNPRVRSIADYSSSSEKADLGMLDFTISGDFTKTFNWNVKQLFVYLVAEYETPENALNQVVLWDKIVLRSERVVLDERRLQSKYYFLDDGANLLNHPNVTLVLRYNVVPNAGYIRLSQAEGQAIVKFPATYTTKKH
ncbi:Signal peptidase complex subunit 3 [Trichostrongylus colubriformis]|uniref:Signal peptidase complex subunit 3 n=1 Tax=Trichostrongylus colubriformis TaxID=6319 RepID=A0AAN8FNQ1_TRICO